MASLNEIIIRSHTIATQRGADAHDNPVIDAEMGLEALFPHALRYSLAKSAMSGGSLQDLTRTLPLTFTSGEADLPASVLKESVMSTVLPTRPYASYMPFGDYKRDRFDNLLDYFSFNGNTALYTQAGTAFTGTLQMNFVVVPTPPTDPDLDLGYSEKIINNVILVMVGAITGEIPIQELLKIEV